MIAWILGFIGAVATLAGIWLIPLYIKLSKNEKATRSKEDEIDAIEPDIRARTTGHQVTEGQAQKMIENAKKRPQRELDRLKQERQFIIDKLPFFKR